MMFKSESMDFDVAWIEIEHFLVQVTSIEYFHPTYSSKNFINSSEEIFNYGNIMFAHPNEGPMIFILNWLVDISFIFAAN